MIILLVPLGLLLLVAAAEGLIWSATRDDYDWKAFGVSMADLAGTIIKRFVLPIGLASPLFHFAYDSTVVGVSRG